MEKELRDLQPRLIETSKETEELIKVIELETVEVEQAKSLVEADEATANNAAQDAKAIKVTAPPAFDIYSHVKLNTT